MLDNLTSIFTKNAGGWLETLSAASVFVTLVQGVASVTVIGGGAYLAFKNSAALRRGIFGGHTAIVGETFYTPTGKTNPETGNEFVKQKLRTHKAALDMEGIFHQSLQRRMLKYITAASKHCTQDDPIVFNHLHKVIPAKDYAKMHNLFTLAWRNHFSEYLNGGTGAERRVPDGRFDFVEEVKLPLLVWEPSTNHKQFRVLFVPKKWVDGNCLPDSADMLVQKGAEHYELDASYHHHDRLKTNQAILAHINKDPQKWIDDFGVGFSTGKTVKVALPKPIAS